MQIIRLLFHLGTLLPFYFGFYYAGVAYLLFVAVFYIKTMKYEAHLKELESSHGKDSESYQDIKKARDRLKYMTFLK